MSQLSCQIEGVIYISLTHTMITITNTLGVALGDGT